MRLGKMGTNLYHGRIGQAHFQTAANKDGRVIARSLPSERWARTAPEYQTAPEIQSKTNYPIINKKG